MLAVTPRDCLVLAAFDELLEGISSCCVEQPIAHLSHAVQCHERLIDERTKAFGEFGGIEALDGHIQSGLERKGAHEDRQSSQNQPLGVQGSRVPASSSQSSVALSV